jgi:predicted transcriptional regulator
MPHITAAELRIMKVIWQLGSCTVRQTLNALPVDEGSPPAYTTIMTMMKQLADKGALDVDCERQPFVYTPVVRRDQVLRQRVTQFLKTVFDGHAEDLVLHLVEEAELSAADIRRIEAKIRKREKTNK